MSDPYNIYSYLYPYLTHDVSDDTEFHFDAGNWMGKYGMYLTPFDSREVERVKETSDYDVKELRNEALINAENLDLGLGKMGFTGGYGYDVIDRMNDKVTNAMQLNKLRSMQAVSDIERQYSSQLYTELGRMADLGAFDLDELRMQGVGGEAVYKTEGLQTPGAKTPTTQGGQVSFGGSPMSIMDAILNREMPAFNFDPSRSFNLSELEKQGYRVNRPNDPYTAMLRRIEDEKDQSEIEINRAAWDAELGDKCPCPGGGFSRVCCEAEQQVYPGGQHTVSPGEEANIVEYDPYTGEAMYTEEHLANVEAYNTALNAGEYTGLDYTGDLQNCMASGMPQEMCSQIMRTMEEGVTSGGLGLGGGEGMLEGTSIYQTTDDYDLLYGEFGNTEQAEGITQNIANCMSGTGDWATLAGCIQQGQVDYSQARESYVSDVQMQDWSRMASGQRNDVQCFDGDHAAYNPTGSNCLTWAKHKGWSSERFYREHVSNFTNLSYEEWLESVGGSWTVPGGGRGYMGSSIS